MMHFFASYDAFFASYDALLPHMISYDVGPFLVNFFHVCLSEVFCFFSILWFCQSSLGFRLLYNFGWHFHSAKVSHSGGRGCPFAGPYFFKKPFCKTLFGGAPFPGPMQSPFAGPQVQVKGATQVGLVLLAAGLLLLFFFLDFASCQPPSCSFVLVELVPSQLLGGPDPGLALGLSHWVDLQGCKSKVGRKIADHSPTESSNLHFWCQPFLSQENLCAVFKTIFQKRKGSGL